MAFPPMRNSMFHGPLTQCRASGLMRHPLSGPIERPTSPKTEWPGDLPHAIMDLGITRREALAFAQHGKLRHWEDPSDTRRNQSTMPPRRIAVPSRPRKKFGTPLRCAKQQLWIFRLYLISSFAFERLRFHHIACTEQRSLHFPHIYDK